MASHPQQSAFYAILLAKVNWRKPPQHFAEPTSPQVKPKQPDDHLPEQRCLILREPAIHPEGKVASQNDNSREARNTYSEGAAYFGGTSPLTATNVATPGGLPAFPYFAASENKSTLLQEVEKRHEQGVYITKKRCAELDGAARLRLNFCD